MNDKPSLYYRLFVGMLLFSLVGALVYTDHVYMKGDSLDPSLSVSNVLADVGSAEYTGEEKSAEKDANAPGEWADAVELPEDTTHGGVRPDFYAERLLAIFDGATIVDSEEVMNSDGSLLKRDVILTEEKYPLITREISYNYDDGAAAWIPVKGSAWVAAQVLMGLEGGQSLDALDSILEDFDAELVQNVRDENVFLIRFRNVETAELDDKISALRLYGAIAYAEPNYFRVSTATPNDSSFHNLWALNNLGSGSGNFDADIDAPEAWEITTGDHNVVVAVIDTGIQIDHPDLLGRIYYNLLETENGIDDDGNGFIDDINGWNFYEVSEGSNDVGDTSVSHGTHVAGIIAANGNNQVGVVGVSPGVTILPVKIFNEQGGYASDLIRGMNYAAMMGASIINVSLGGSDESQAEAAMINELQKRGILLVVSAGNSGQNADVAKSYPGSYPHNNIINVAASNWFDQLESYSAYGLTSVDICAPGTQIFSTVAIDGYDYYSGTSMAAPHVTGVAALVKSVKTDWDASMLKDAILSTVDPLDTAVGKTVSGGRVNAMAAVQYAMENTFFPNGLHIRIKSAVNGLYVNPTTEDDFAQLIADGVEAGKSQTFEVVQVDENTYAFRSLYYGKYVTVEAGGSEPLSATRDAVSDWELFYPINMGDGTYAFRSKANGLIVTAESEAQDTLIANRETVGEWETFEIETLHLLPVGKMVVLQSAVSGLFVSPNEQGVLFPSETVAGMRNIFRVGLSMDGFLTLEHFESGLYVSAKTKGNLPLVASQNDIGDWEKFVAISNGKGHIALRCKANGQFVKSNDSGTSALVANSDEMEYLELFNFYTP